MTVNDGCSGDIETREIDVIQERDPREIPDTITLSPCPYEYANLLAMGWDTIEESAPFSIKPTLQEHFQKLKEIAQDRGQEGGPVSFEIANEQWLMSTKGGSGGWLFVIRNSDFDIWLKKAGTEWGVKIHFNSSGLWLKGYEVLSKRADYVLSVICKRENESARKVIRADFACDFYSPDFTNNFSPETYAKLFCLHHKRYKRLHGVLSAHGHGAKWETITLGKINSLQVQVYDKAKEITDISGKDWFETVWCNNDGILPYKDKPVDIWRVEIRLGKGFLENRSCREAQNVQKFYKQLLCEALYTIRLSTEDGEEQIRNRPAHPLWSEIIRKLDVHYWLPLGKRVTGRRDALVARAGKQIAGSIRSMSILDGGSGDGEDLEIILGQIKIIADEDADKSKKIIAAKDRYKFVDEAK